jgi:6-phosphofructokinase 1
MTIQTMGILTSGGDAPGINPCIRAAVRTALFHDVEVIGIQEGFDGLIRGEMTHLRARDVGNILGRGGTFLRTARSKEFEQPKYQRKALRELNESSIDGLIVIGGDGSMRGAHVFTEYDFPVIGAPASIDNDIWGTDMSMGVDTAVNTIMEAVDKLRDTASSHQRVFLVETMGRNCGYLALVAGVVCGAEMILLPEVDVSMEDIATRVADSYARGKAHAIIVAAEGASLDVQEVAQYLNERDVGFEVRVTILGHITRGGSPTAFDRLLATRMGVKAVELLLEGERDKMVGLSGREMVAVPLEEVIKRQRQPNIEFHHMAQMLAR